MSPKWMAASRWIYLVAAAILWVPIGGVAGWAAKSGTASSAARFEQPAPAVVPQSAFPGVRVTYVGGGTFQVPAQAAPGTYIVTASGNTFGCSWLRLKADDDRQKSVIDSGTVNRGEFGQFTVSRSDRVLKLLGDCMWRQP